MMVPACRVVAFAVAVLTASASRFAAPAGAQDRSALAISAGGFDILRRGYRAAQLDVRYRDHRRLWLAHPVVGISLTTEATVHSYVGIGLEVPLARRLVARPSFAPGLYHRGRGKNLGSAIEFRSGIELAYRFDDGARLGVELSHLSNAGLRRPNPGAESLLLTYSAPMAQALGARSTRARRTSQR